VEPSEAATEALAEADAVATTDSVEKGDTVCGAAIDGVMLLLGDMEALRDFVGDLVCAAPTVPATDREPATDADGDVLPDAEIEAVTEPVSDGVGVGVALWLPAAATSITHASARSHRGAACFRPHAHQTRERVCVLGAI